MSLTAQQALTLSGVDAVEARPPLKRWPRQPPGELQKGRSRQCTREPWESRRSSQTPTSASWSAGSYADGPGTDEHSDDWRGSDWVQRRRGTGWADSWSWDARSDNNGPDFQFGDAWPDNTWGDFAWDRTRGATGRADSQIEDPWTRLAWPDYRWASGRDTILPPRTRASESFDVGSDNASGAGLLWKACPDSSVASVLHSGQGRLSWLQSDNVFAAVQASALSNSVRHPADVTDERFMVDRKRRWVRCDDCGFEKRGDAAGRFLCREGMPDAGRRWLAWWLGNWNATWYCVECYARVRCTTPHAIRRDFGFTERAERKRSYLARNAEPMCARRKVVNRQGGR